MERPGRTTIAHRFEDLVYHEISASRRYSLIVSHGILVPPYGAALMATHGGEINANGGNARQHQVKAEVSYRWRSGATRLLTAERTDVDVQAKAGVTTLS